MAELVRVARRATGELVMERSAPGRGAWLCKGCEDGVPAEDCLEQAIRRRAFSRAFGVAVSSAAEALLRETVTERARIKKSGETVLVSRRRD